MHIKYDKNRVKIKNGYPICNVCGSLMTDFDGVDWYTCSKCGNAVKLCSDGDVRWQDEIFGPQSAMNGNRTCEHCGGSLAGAPSTESWEDENNADGYIKCPHCGWINFIPSGDD